MPIIRQESLFSINELYAMQPTQRYDAIISVIDIDHIYREVSKNHVLELRRSLTTLL